MATSLIVLARSASPPACGAIRKTSAVYLYGERERAREIYTYLYIYIYIYIWLTRFLTIGMLLEYIRVRRKPRDLRYVHVWRGRERKREREREREGEREVYLCIYICIWLTPPSLSSAQTGRLRHVHRREMRE